MSSLSPQAPATAFIRSSSFFKSSWRAANRSLTETWTGTTVFELIREYPGPGQHYVCGELFRKIKTERPPQIHPHEWPRLSRKGKKEAQETWTKVLEPMITPARTAHFKDYNPTFGVSHVNTNDKEEVGVMRSRADTVGKLCCDMDINSTKIYS